MKNRYILGIVSAGALLAGCSTNGSGINPPVSHGNLGADKLQMAVGTANIAFDGTVGLNVVTTFRQPNGLSAVLLDTPTITGPAGFVVTGNAPANDAGTDHISGSPQTAPGPTTFGTAGGAFKYGFAPYNSDNLGDPYPNGPALYAEPFYSGDAVPIAGGPPAYPFFNNGTFISGFQGYSQGFNAFETPVTVGSYSLTVNVPGTSGPGRNFTATATLASAVPLPALGAPSFVEDGAGGGTASVTVPADPRIFETMIYIADLNASTFFTLGPFNGTGSVGGALPDTLGPCNGNDCQNGSGATPSLPAGDSYLVYAISYDYPAFEASPPGSSSQTPAITGPNSGGQADISMSQVFAGTYLVRGSSHIRPHRH
ncbi:MAG TPA: hypothetical protein VKT51_09460 [Candidatus Eremiobacteraceae bacterium]|nr:hypothetical protein [Candidatus Eremiobacteraceae bacterium]